MRFQLQERVKRKRTPKELEDLKKRRLIVSAEAAAAKCIVNVDDCTPSPNIFCDKVLLKDLFTSGVALCFSISTIGHVALACKRGADYMKRFQLTNDGHIHNMCVTRHVKLCLATRGYVHGCMRCEFMRCGCKQALYSGFCIPDDYDGLIEDGTGTWDTAKIKCHEHCPRSRFGEMHCDDY